LRGRTEPDPALRHAVYQELQDVLASDAVVVPLFHEQTYRFFGPGIEGVRIQFGFPEVAYEEIRLTGDYFEGRWSERIAGMLSLRNLRVSTTEHKATAGAPSGAAEEAQAGRGGDADMDRAQPRLGKCRPTSNMLVFSGLDGRWR